MENIENRKGIVTALARSTRFLPLLAIFYILFASPVAAFAAGCTGTGNCYWVGGTGNWSDTSHWATTDGGATTGGLPTSADNVNFTALSNATAYTVTQDQAGAVAKDMTWALPGTSGVPTFTGSTGINLSGSMTLVAGMSWTFSGAISFTSSVAGKTITTAGVTLINSITVSGSGSWTLQDNLSTDNVRVFSHTGGTLDLNGKTVTVGFWSSTGSGVRTLTATNATINVTATSGTPWNVVSSNFTFNSTGSTINVNGGVAAGSIIIATGGLANYNTLNITAAGTVTLAQGGTIKNLSYTSTTDKRDNLSINSGSLSIAAGGSLTFAGNSTVNRAFVHQTTLGTTITITVPSTATVTLNNVDFQDIVAAGTFGGWAYNAGTNSSLGDALGNSGITFDPSATQTYAGGTNNWSTAAAWTSRVPLPQDDVVVNTTTAGTLTRDMPRLGRNIDFTGFTRTLANSVNISSVFGNITLSSSMAFTQPAGNVGFIFQGRGAQTVKTNGKAFVDGVTFQSFGGSYTLQDDMVSSSVSLNNGTLDFVTFNVTAPNFASPSNGAASVRNLKLGTGTFSITNNTGSPWNIVVATNLTITPGASTIKFSSPISTTETFAGGSFTYNNLWFSSTTGNGNAIITGSNTFNDFKVDGTTARTVQFTAGTTNTFSSFSVSGKAGQLITITSDTTGTHNLVLAGGGRVGSDYLNIQHSVATPASKWYAGSHSVNNQGVATAGSGWIFTALPFITTSKNQFLGGVIRFIGGMVRFR